IHDCSDECDRKYYRYAAHAASRQDTRAFRPADQRFRIEPRAQIFSAQRNVFMQIEFRSELNDERLPLEDFRLGRWREQPLCQATFSHRQTCSGEQLEEAAAAEEIEIVRVNVLFIAKAFAGLAGAEPAIIDAGDSFFVIGRRGLRAVMAAKNLFVD